MTDERRIALIRDRQSARIYDPYVEVLIEEGFVVEAVDSADDAADTMDLGGVSLILIQLAYLTSPKYSGDDLNDGQTTGAIIAQVMRERGVKQPIFLINLGGQRVSDPYHKPRNGIEVLQLIYYPPEALATRCAKRLQHS